MIPDFLWHHFKVGGIAFLIAAMMTPIIRFLAVKAGVMDMPSTIKVHSKPIPRLGGVAIFFGFLISLLVTESLSLKQEAVVIGASLALIIGILDDTKSVPATVKLVALFFITWFLSQRGVILKLTPFYIVNFTLTLFWVVGVTSAFNAMDNMDGVAAGVTFFASAAYAYVAFQNYQWGWAALAVAMMGSCLGFLVFNFPPASIFMGDSGSFFLGYCLAVMSVIGEWSTNPFKSIAVPVFILGLPIFDLIYVVLKRHRLKITRGLKQIVTFSAKDHFTHRLQKLGLSHRQVTLFTYASALCLSIGAVTMRYVHKVEAMLLCVQYLVIISLITVLMELMDRRITSITKRGND